MRAVVVVPVYSSVISKAEMASFRQCVMILGKHDIVLVSYQQLNCTVYGQIASDFGVALKYEFFDPYYFSSVRGYNQLCLSPVFYRRFAYYDYMLVYQLDAWVFRDELDAWCQKGYDYIGAPWFKKCNGEFTSDFSGFVGNGGFSLRKISFCLKVVTRQNRLPVLTPRGLWMLLSVTRQEWQEWLKFPFRCMGAGNNSRYFFSLLSSEHVLNEDMLFSLYRYSYWHCSIPDSKEASRFSFEVHPDLLFEMINKQLPFGCHAYMKNEYESFWNKYIQIKS